MIVPICFIIITAFTYTFLHYFDKLESDTNNPKAIQFIFCALVDLREMLEDLEVFV